MADIEWKHNREERPFKGQFQSDFNESALVKSSEKTEKIIRNLLGSCKVYQFSDSSISSPMRLASTVDSANYLQSEYPLSGEKIRVLKDETDIYGDPEMINNSPDTAPSKRIIAALAQDYHYNKVQSGAAVTAAIGIEALLENCQHFKEWIENIKRIAAQ